MSAGDRPDQAREQSYNNSIGGATFGSKGSAHCPATGDRSIGGVIECMSYSRYSPETLHLLY